MKMVFALFVFHSFVLLSLIYSLLGICTVCKAAVMNRPVQVCFLVNQCFCKLYWYIFLLFEFATSLMTSVGEKIKYGDYVIGARRLHLSEHYLPSLLMNVIVLIPVDLSKQ
jgi:hypothetical protein